MARRAGAGFLAGVLDVDPNAIRFTDLHQWVRALPGFDDDPKRGGEKVLEAIQQAWIDETS
jgi:FeS assembly protein IscX